MTGRCAHNGNDVVVIDGGITAIFGGAFDPIHFGHLKPVLELCACPQIKRIHMVPCGAHPYVKEMADDIHRFRMLKLVHKPPRLIADDCACKNKNLMYTADLLEYFRVRHGNEPMALIVGSDSYADMSNWKNANKIKDLSHIIVLAREPGIQGIDQEATLDDLANQRNGLTHYFDNTLMNVSSTQVRSLLKAGKQPIELIPGTVWNYVRRHGLYGIS